MANNFSPRRLIVPLVLFTVALIVILTTNSTTTATSYIFPSVADTYVDANNPTTNFGTDSVVWMDATPA